jgi:hypothetical protein
MIFPSSTDSADIVREPLDSLIVKEHVNCFLGYYELGMRAYHWTSLTEYVIIARAFIRRFADTGTGEEEVIKILQSLQLRGQKNERFLNLLELYIDPIFCIYSNNVDKFLSSALAHLQQYKAEPNDVQLREQIITFLSFLANSSLAAPGLAPITFFPEEEILQRYSSSLPLATTLAGRAFSPYTLCITLESARPERILRLWMLLFVLASQLMDQGLKVWAEGKYSPLPLDAQHLDDLTHFYVTFEDCFKSLLAFSANSLESDSRAAAFKSRALASWQQISENFEGQATQPEANTLVLGGLTSVLGEIQAQQQFLMALVRFYIYDQREEDFMKLKEALPPTFSYHQWLYLVEKYPYPANPWLWPWPIYWG